MIEVLPSDVTAIAKEFLLRDDIEVFIEYARLFICEDKWGDKAKLGIILMTAHLMTELDIGSQPGFVTSETVGDLSRGYGMPTSTGLSASDSLLMTTKYGKQFALIRKTIVTTPLVV